VFYETNTISIPLYLKTQEVNIVERFGLSPYPQPNTSKDWKKGLYRNKISHCNARYFAALRFEVVTTKDEG
jgi:hypothetical protein